MKIITSDHRRRKKVTAAKIERNDQETNRSEKLKKRFPLSIGAIHGQGAALTSLYYACGDILGDGKKYKKVSQSVSFGFSTMFVLRFYSILFYSHYSVLASVTAVRFARYTSSSSLLAIEMSCVERLKTRRHFESREKQ